jgi:hypothetical protein
MALIYPNIVPENNLRLPDALTIKHGPAPLLAKFVLEGDKAAREVGVRLRLRNDFAELLYVNKHAAVRQNWYPLLDIFNPEYSDLIPENSYWISGEDEHGEIILTQAGRVYYWPDTTLEQEARLMFHGGREKGQRCVVTAADAKLITGVVFYGGAGWVRPEFRGRRLMRLVPRLGRAYALARWPVDWGISFVLPNLVDNGVAAGYGYQRASYSIYFPGSVVGDVDVVLVSLSASEAYADFADALDRLGRSAPSTSASSTSISFLDDRDTKISSDRVLQGSSSRS